MIKYAAMTGRVLLSNYSVTEIRNEEVFILLPLKSSTEVCVLASCAINDTCRLV